MLKLSVLVISLACLAGCAASINANPTVATPNQVVIAINAFNAAEVTATNYLKLPLCVAAASPLCRTAAATSSIVSATRSGYRARNQLLADLQTNVSAPLTLIQALTTAVTTLQQAAQ